VTARTETDRAIQGGYNHITGRVIEWREIQKCKRNNYSQSNEVLCRSVKVKHVILIHLVL
jgi:hypothetical protein